MDPQIVPQPRSNELKTAGASPAFLTVQQKRQEIRELLLVKAAKFAPASIPVAVFCEQLRREGCDVSVRDLERELQYLLDKAMIVDVPQVISPEIHRYRIHANGRDYLAEQGLDDE